MSKAAIYLIIATLLFAGHNIGVKCLSHMPTVQIVFMRGIISLIICVVSLRYMKIPMTGNNKPMLFLRGLTGTISLFGLFYCLQRMPIGVTTVLVYTAPLFTVLIAHFVLKERARPIQAVLLVGAFVGVLIVKGWSVDVSWFMGSLCIGVAFVAACAYTCVRVLRTTDHPMVVIMYFPLVTVPMMIIPTIQNWVAPTPAEWGVLIGIGVLTQFAQYFMTMAYQMEAASSIMIFNYAAIIWGVLAGVYLFDEQFNVYQIIGMVMVLVCLVMSSLVRAKTTSE